MKDNSKGGEEASSNHFNRHSDRPVHVLYMDHIIYLKTNPKLFREPNIRETIGWIIKEDCKKIQMVWDRSLKLLPYEIPDLECSGITIMKNAILKRKKLG